MLVALTLLTTLPLPAHAAEKRVALLIGNGSYSDKPLKNPVNDAEDLAKVLGGLGFEVTLKKNLKADQMKEAIAEFGDRLAQSKGVGLFYYSGHGVQVKGNNYLLPVGREFKRERDVELFAVEARTVLGRMEEGGNALNIVILDACRDSPLPAESRSSGSRGLARMDTPTGSLVAFATAPNSTASDNGEERNGLYTKHLMQALQEPGLRLEDVFGKVRIAVENASNRRQSPEEITKLRGEPFYFKPGSGTQVASLKPEPVPAVSAPAPRTKTAAEIEREAWDGAKASGSQDAVAEYLKQYPKGRYVSNARLSWPNSRKLPNWRRLRLPLSRAKRKTPKRPCGAKCKRAAQRTTTMCISSSTRKASSSR
jgi:uncharacterized caspase-like protein